MDSEKLTAMKPWLALIRSHWGVESMNHTLDSRFTEDAHRTGARRTGKEVIHFGWREVRSERR